MAFSITNLLARGKVGYIVNRENFGGYIIDSICIAQYREERIGRVLAGTIDNRDGYGSDEAARGIGAACSNAIEEGYDLAYYRQHAYGDNLSVRLEWQHYAADRYCSTIRAAHVGSELEDMFVGMNFLRWLGNKVDKDARNTTHALSNPSRVVAARGMRARRGERRAHATRSRQGKASPSSPPRTRLALDPDEKGVRGPLFSQYLQARLGSKCAS